jgi:hypothetical protein
MLAAWLLLLLLPDLMSANSSQHDLNRRAPWRGVLNTTHYRDLTRSLFTHSYDGYMKHAFPLDELDPIHCVGRGVDPG